MTDKLKCCVPHYSKQPLKRLLINRQISQPAIVEIERGRSSHKKNNNTSLNTIQKYRPNTKSNPRLSFRA